MQVGIHPWLLTSLPSRERDRNRMITNHSRRRSLVPQGDSIQRDPGAGVWGGVGFTEGVTAELKEVTLNPEYKWGPLKVLGRGACDGIRVYRRSITLATKWMMISGGKSGVGRPVRRPLGSHRGRRWRLGLGKWVEKVRCGRHRGQNRLTCCPLRLLSNP